MSRTVDDMNLYEDWLEQSQEDSYKSFIHIRLAEREANRAIHKSAIVHKVFIYHNDPEEFRDELERCGYRQTLEALDKRPKADKTRKGNFGEILACEYLQCVAGFEVPVKRFRYNPHPELSMRGEDGLAFKFGDEAGYGREICVVESKVQSRFNRTKIGDAVKDQLADRRYIISLKFVSSVLWTRGDREKSRKVREFMNKTASIPSTRSDFLMLVTEISPDDPFDVVAELDLKGINLTAANLSIADLSNFVAELFEADIDVAFV